MSFLRPTITSISNSSFDEERWVIQIRRTLDDDNIDDEYTEIPVSIFNVPKSLMVSSPDCYIPQQVALGPYHYWRPELYEMERYKLDAARRLQKHLQNMKFQQLVEELTKVERMFRASYHKFLDINGETLAWMMAVDASFMLEFLRIYAIKEGKPLLTRVSSRMSHLVDVDGRKSAHNAILRDMVMLENQIPFFMLRKMLEFQYCSLEIADTMLFSMLRGLCRELCPFKMVEEIPIVRLTAGAHLLDFLYHVVVPKSEESPEVTEVAGDQLNEEKKEEETSFVKSSTYVKKHLGEIWKILLKINKSPVRLIKRIICSRLSKVIFKLPWTVISDLPGVRVLKQTIEAYLCFSQATEDDQVEKENDVNKPPLIEEIAIPSVTELSKAGVSFLPTTSGGIMSITFNNKTSTLFLPTISLDVNTEIILRNLVAYEACNASGPLIFTRYTELMNGIIDNQEDAKLLRRSGIILNRLKSDEEVANLWNGMSKCIRLTKVPFLDKVIEDVNKHYNNKWKVKVGKVMKMYVFGSWQCLSFLAAVMLLLLTSLQAFCSVYSCGRLFNVKRS